jgi:hypothetical protein
MYRGLWCYLRQAITILTWSRTACFNRDEVLHIGITLLAFPRVHLKVERSGVEPLRTDFQSAALPTELSFQLDRFARSLRSSTYI